MKPVITKLEASIKAVALPRNKTWCEKYLKYKVESYGVKAPGIKQIFKEHWQDDVKMLDSQTQIKLANYCINHTHMEFRNIGMLILEKNIKFLDINYLNNDLKNSIMKSCNEWATCDGLSKIIRLMIINDNSIANQLLNWKDNENIWIQRASCVSFVCLLRKYPNKFNDIIFEICQTCVNNNERFVQLGVGWILREVSVKNLDKVIEFIQTNYHLFSREGLRYAIEKMDSNTRYGLLNYNKNENNKNKVKNRENDKNNDNDTSHDDNEQGTREKSRKKKVAKTKDKSKRQSKIKERKKKKEEMKCNGDDYDDAPPRKKRRKVGRVN